MSFLLKTVKSALKKVQNLTSGGGGGDGEDKEAASVIDDYAMHNGNAAYER